MIYCMSDIHGEVERFEQMLDLIGFSGEDTLYIIGDVIDRHPGGAALLRKILDTPNMVMLLGNHEKMCLETLGPNTFEGAQARWYRNGGDITHGELNLWPEEDVRRLLDDIASLPLHLEVEVGGQIYHLVHGFPGETERDQVWGRPNADTPRPFPDRIAIFGHTAACRLYDDMDHPFRIWYGDGMIDIDCGCAYRSEHKRLGCLRLDDMKEFYV